MNERVPAPDIALATEIHFDAVYYDGQSSVRRAARVRLQGAALSVELEGERARKRLLFQVHEVGVGSRLGNTTRSLTLPGGAKLETEDNDAVDRLKQAWGGGGIRPHLLESSWRAVLVALGVLAGASGVFFVWGIPFLAERAAMSMPDELAFDIGNGTMATLDKSLFSPSELAAERQEELRENFQKMARLYPRLPLKLLFRRAGMANAFALPNGKVVVTDELVALAKTDEEVYAVLAHEIGHVEHRHTARMAIETSAVGVLAMLYLGDASQASSVAAALPAIYANSHYSRAHETEADTFALEYMQRAGLSTEAFADILERMSSEAGGSQPEVLKYISSHPATKERSARFRH